MIVCILQIEQDLKIQKPTHFLVRKEFAMKHSHRSILLALIFSMLSFPVFAQTETLDPNDEQSLGLKADQIHKEQQKQTQIQNTLASNPDPASSVPRSPMMDQDTDPLSEYNLGMKAQKAKQ